MLYLYWSKINVVPVLEHVSATESIDVVLWGSGRGQYGMSGGQTGHA